MVPNNPLDTVREQLVRAARILPAGRKEDRVTLDQKLTILKHPQRVLSVGIPVRMDNGSLNIYHITIE